MRSHLDYCDIIYHIPSRQNQPPLGVTLNLQAALAISGAWRTSSCSKLYEELGWEILSDRRMCWRILQIYKISGNKTPSYQKRESTCKALFSGNIRNTFREIICKSNSFKNSFFPDAIASWNIFIKHFDDYPSFQVLKVHINTRVRPMTKSTYQYLCSSYDYKYISIPVFVL